MLNEYTYGSEEASSDKEEEKLKKIYEASQIEIPKSIPFQPSYRFLTVAYQIAGSDLEKVFEILKKNSQLPMDMEGKNFAEIDANDIERFKRRLNQVKNWLELYAPEFVKFQVQKKLPRVEISDVQKEFLLKVQTFLKRVNTIPRSFMMQCTS